MGTRGVPDFRAQFRTEGLAQPGFLSPVPWLPAEVIELEDESFVGYEVATEDVELTLLRNDPRIITSVPVEEVASRTICQLEQEEEGRWDVSLSELLVGRTDEYPPCRAILDELEPSD
jgi:hypothetical protein